VVKTTAPYLTKRQVPLQNRGLPPRTISGVAVHCHSEEQESAIIALSCDVGISSLEIATSSRQGLKSLA
jgi:hypothetical protein